MTDRYVYSGAGGANNGSTPTDAWTSLASCTGLTDGDVIWIHRDHTQTLSANLSLPVCASAVATTNPGTVTYCGWPISGDALYSARPAAGISAGWDGATANYPTVNRGAGTSWGVLVDAAGQSSQTNSDRGLNLRRFRVTGTGGTSSAAIINLIAITRPSKHENIKLDITASAAFSQVIQGLRLGPDTIEVDGLDTDFTGAIAYLSCEHLNCVMPSGGTLTIKRHVADDYAMGGGFALHVDGTLVGSPLRVSAGTVRAINCDYSALNTAVAVDNSSASVHFLLVNCKIPVAGLMLPVYPNNENVGCYAASLHHNQIVNAWMAQTEVCIYEKTADFRTGGGTFAIKMSPQAVNPWTNPRAFTIGTLSRTPYETIGIPLTAGVAKTITIYLAENSWASLTGNEVWMEVEYLNTSWVTETTEGDALGSDTSTWSGGENAFKLSLTVVATADCLAFVRVHLNHYESNKYILVDPLIQ